MAATAEYDYLFKVSLCLAWSDRQCAVTRRLLAPPSLLTQPQYAGTGHDVDERH